jgi:ribA/ribD-fused uncharacterized protein
MIDSFDGEYRFLSNFYPSTLHINGYTFYTVEAAFQACKSEDPKDWTRFQYLNASQAKKEGRKLNLRPDWNDVRISVMRELLQIKFSMKPFTMQLVSTLPHELVEGNHWGDTFWGVCKGVGENNLGKLLMEIRAELQGDLPW